MCSGIPETPGQLVQFVVAVQNLHVQQRSLTKPIIVQCRYYKIIYAITVYETFLCITVTVIIIIVCSVRKIESAVFSS